MSESIDCKTHTQFDACHRLYYISTLSLNAPEDILVSFQAIIIFVGIMLGSTALYSVIDMYNELLYRSV